MDWTPTWLPSEEDQHLVIHAMKMLRQVGIQMTPEMRALSATWFAKTHLGITKELDADEDEDDPMKTAFLMLVHVGGFLAFRDTDMGVLERMAKKAKEGARR